MTSVFRTTDGDLPLLISVPHDGREIPEDLRSRMTDAGRAIPDTDWHVAKLYGFATELGANTIVANYSRYVVDLNRSADDESLYPGQTATGLFPEHTFAGDAVYSDGGVDDDEKAGRIDQYWHPYHKCIRDTLDTLREQHGFALLWDAHSIPSVVPRLFDGELPTLNLGSNNGASCESSIERAVNAAATESNYSSVLNERFKGGFITRHYGDPENGVHALQLEIAQRAYMTEQTSAFDTEKAAVLRDTLQKMLRVFTGAGQSMTSTQ
jgi:N-formylglutamate amidohydrolase